MNCSRPIYIIERMRALTERLKLMNNLIECEKCQAIIEYNSNFECSECGSPLTQDNEDIDWEVVVYDVEKEIFMQALWKDS